MSKRLKADTNLDDANNNSDGERRVGSSGVVVETVSAVLSAVLLVLGLAGTFAGTARVVRHRTTEGVSVSTTALGLMSALGWCSYGLVYHVPLQLLTNGPGALGAFLVLFVAWKTGRLTSPAKVFAALLTYGLFTYFAVATLGLAALGVILIGLSVILRMPQLRETWKSPGGEGISVSSYVLNICSATGWTAYGLMHGEIAVVATSVYAAFTMAFILIRTVSARRSALRVVAPDLVPATAVLQAA